jgi:hypothetical protein
LELAPKYGILVIGWVNHDQRFGELYHLSEVCHHIEWDDFAFDCEVSLPLLVKHLCNDCADLLFERLEFSRVLEKEEAIGPDERRESVD